MDVRELHAIHMAARIGTGPPRRGDPCAFLRAVSPSAQLTTAPGRGGVWIGPVETIGTTVSPDHWIPRHAVCDGRFVRLRLQSGSSVQGLESLTGSAASATGAWCSVLAIISVLSVIVGYFGAVGHCRLLRCCRSFGAVDLLRTRACGNHARENGAQEWRSESRMPTSRVDRYCWSRIGRWFSLVLRCRRSHPAGAKGGDIVESRIGHAIPSKLTT